VQARDDGRLAAELAVQAGALLVGLRVSSAAGGLTGMEAGALGDERSNEAILAGLAAARPQDAVLSEESADDPRRLDAARVWIVDPLDGTREYGLDGRDDWAVHVALWERVAAHDGRSGITAAAVALPALGTVMTTDAPPVVPARPDASGPLRTVVSDSRPPAWLADLADVLPLAVHPMGSAGAKAMAVVGGEADVYVHSGGQYEWDSAAPVGVAVAAGLHASRLDGSPLVYNEERPYLPDLVICRPEAAGELLDALARIGAR
jgi:3'(2'), 5'-bisphosphate nucleotidase